jgi:hypothetical protein
MISRTRHLERVDTERRTELIDELMDRYVEWREQCIAVAETYERWSTGPVAHREAAFAAFTAALDREQHASYVYADRVSRIERELASRLDRRVTIGSSAAT